MIVSIHVIFYSAAFLLHLFAILWACEKTYEVFKTYNYFFFLLNKFIMYGSFLSLAMITASFAFAVLLSSKHMEIDWTKYYTCIDLCLFLSYIYACTHEKHL